MSCIVSPTGAASTRIPRPTRDYHRPVSAGTRKRNDLFLALGRGHGLAPAQIGRLYALKASTVRSGILEASKRAETKGDPAPAIDGPDFTRAELLDTPIGDTSLRYRDDPDALEWAERHAHYFRPDPTPPPLSRGIRRRPR